jgi:hypothetical protein
MDLIQNCQLIEYVYNPYARLGIIIIFYIIFEYINYRKYRHEYKSAIVPVYGDKCGSYEDLLWYYESLTNSEQPVEMNIEDISFYTSKKLTWEDIYVLNRDYLCITDSEYNKKKHDLLAKCTYLQCKKMNISVPCEDEIRHVSFYHIPPIMHGKCTFTSIYKPVALIGVLKIFGYVVDLYSSFSGYKTHTMYTPEGEIDILVKDVKSRKTLVFIHGISLYGSVPYIPLFNKLINKNKFNEYNVVMIQIPNLSFSKYQNRHFSFGQLSMDLHHFLIKNSFNKYYLLGHSLGSIILTGLLNDERKILKPEKVVLIDPLCFLCDVLYSHRIAFWSWSQICEKIPKLNLLVRWCLLFLCLKDINVQKITKRLTGDPISSIYRQNTYRGEILAYFGDKDYVINSKKIISYVNSHFPSIQTYLEPEAEHGTFVTHAYFSNRFIDTITRFIND